MEPKLKLLALNCTLKPTGASSTEKLLNEVAAEMRADVDAELVRVAALDIKPGVSSDEGDGDEWPKIREKIIACDVLLMGSPVWLGQPSSVAKRILERMDAFLGETDKVGRTPAYGKVAAVVCVGNEDGAHHVSAELFQALADVGFSIAAGGPTYWVGRAMEDVNFKDLDRTPDVVANATKMVARNTLHLARLLRDHPYPGYL
ncbi:MULTISPECIES: NAD(P)H-dependent oxidoreductase [unclassified Chelatococcus]|uniref:flavodoxin family protein n=1 Tax=unclassified Chelatococcus TaxID=2638111 RepID=UPI001BCCA1CD|nr:MULTISPECIES: NAD(P)H-dependent oxidoreductase [unclassified Chelatococcus]MBS7700056.1 NAD(P)H-dependent oxidoreductase [Chelatococcus sp. YT9]MBX3556749.1 NAD(P)H-dependent oxidoreductase [Chelatococcus sp.]